MKGWCAENRLKEAPLWHSDGGAVRSLPARPSPPSAHTQHPHIRTSQPQSTVPTQPHAYPSPPALTPTPRTQAAKPFARHDVDDLHDSSLKGAVRFGDPFAHLARRRAGAERAAEAAALTERYDADKLNKSGEGQGQPAARGRRGEGARVSGRARGRGRGEGRDEGSHTQAHPLFMGWVWVWLSLGWYLHPRTPPCRRRRRPRRLQGAPGGSAPQLAQARRGAARQPLQHPARPPLGRRQPQQRLRGRPV